MFSEERGHRLKEEDTFRGRFNPPNVLSASKVGVGRAAHPSCASVIATEGRRDLEA